MEFTLEDEMRFWEKVDIQGEDECWNWLACLYDKDGYGGFILNGKNERSHRVALSMVNGPPPDDKPQALHSCKQNRLCCNPNHLRWGTHQENMIDRKNDGTTYIAFGENNHNSKLTKQEVREIREKFIPYKYSTYKLAIEYNMSRKNIELIIRGVSYKEQ